jgi:MFS family permease
MNKPKLWTRNFINTSLSSFFLFTTFYCLLVTLPVYALNFFHSKEYEAGLIVTVFILAAILIRPLAGIWIVRFGKRSVLICALLIFTVSTALYFFTGSMMSLLLLRFVHGIGFGIATTVSGTIVADIIPETRRGEGMGYYTMSMNLAMVIGPFIGLTAFGQWGINATIVLSILCTLCALICGLFITLPHEYVIPDSAPKSGAFRFGSLLERSAIRISLVGAFFALVYSAILSFVSVYAKEIGIAEVSSYFFVVYAIVLLLSRPFTGKWLDMYGPNIIVYPAIICFAAGMLLLSLAVTPFLFLFSAALIGLGWGTLFTVLQTIAIQTALPAKRGAATATFLSIFDLGIGIGSVVVGFAGSRIGFSSLYMVCSFLVLAGIVLYHHLYSKGEKALLEAGNISDYPKIS